LTLIITKKLYFCTLKLKNKLVKVVASLHLSSRKLQNELLQNIKRFIMKKGIHPENYRLVAFKDMSNEDVFITKSTVETKETIVHEGVEYPVYKMEISRTSHPFYTGKSKLIDTAGRIDKFKSKYAKHAK
jgi:large subunit ribosomal protein L31